MTDFIYIHEAGDPGLAPFLLLHGTGGDEHDLVDIARAIDPRRAILSPRGKVSEGGANRFFRRFAEGQFDEADVRLRAGELAEFITESQVKYGFAKAPIALGFSNGANIAAALLYLRPQVLSGAMLLRGMVPLQADVPKAQSAPVLLISGAADAIISGENAARLAAVLKAAGAPVQHEVLPAGHGLTQRDLALMQAWLKDKG